MNIQFEVQKIHSQFGTTEMANYQIQKLFDKLILEDRVEQLRKHDVLEQSKELKDFVKKVAKGFDDSKKHLIVQDANTLLKNLPLNP
jgi:hypothetical protein